MNPDLTKTQTPARVARLLATVAAATLSLAACSSSPAPESLASAEPEPTEIVLDEIATDTGDTSTVELAASSTTASSTTVPPTTVVATTAPPTPEPANPEPAAAVTEKPAPVVLAPRDVDGSVESVLGGLQVVTEPGDPLNVRVGPGVSNEIVSALPHGTGELIATHEFVLESGATWRFISQGGVPAGWVNGAYLTTSLPTAHCEAGADFPTFEGAVTTTTGDVDLDGLADEVFVLAESKPAGGYDAWVLVSFGNGGVATGKYAGSWFDPIPTSSVFVSNLTAVEDPALMNEIVLQLGSGVSHAQYAVMAVDGCSVVTTTHDGEAFAFSNGASAGHSTVSGCEYGVHGKVEFVVTSMDFNADEWSYEVFELRGLEWMSVEARDHTDFPGLSAADIVQSAASLSNCEGVS